jgi:DNA gyrase subunit A
MEILTNPDAQILTTTERGYGKRTPLEDYRPQNRGGQGIINIRANERNGWVVGIAQVFDDDDVMLITDGGKVLRCPVNGISSMGRATQGVRVMNLSATSSSRSRAAEGRRGGRGQRAPAIAAADRRAGRGDEEPTPRSIRTPTWRSRWIRRPMAPPDADDE